MMPQPKDYAYADGMADLLEYAAQEGCRQCRRSFIRIMVAVIGVGLVIGWVWL
jgi:hypothetical protein